MPEGQTNSILAKEFATFFHEKIENICDKFTGINEFKPASNEQATPLKNFHHSHVMKYERKYSA